MAVRPEVIPFNDYINAHKEDFTPFELWVVDELSEYLVNKLDLDKEYTSVVVDTDEDTPVAGSEDNQILIRLNGRFYLPKEDRTGKELTESVSEWATIAKEWFDSVDIVVTFDDKAEDLLKFTAMVPTIDLGDISPVEETGEETPPEGEETPPEGEEVTEEEETPPEVETPPEGEEAPVEEKEPEESAPEESSEELDEFEKALGL